MQQIEIDMVGAQPSQALLDAAHHVLAAVAGLGDVGAGGWRVFGGDDEMVAVRGDELADQPLAGAFGIDMRGVDEIAAGLGEGVEHRPALAIVTAPAPVGAEGHRTQAKLGNAQTETPEKQETQEKTPRPRTNQTKKNRRSHYGD